MQPRLILTEPEAIIGAALMDLGVGLVAVPHVLRHLRSGDLKRGLPDWHADAEPISLYFLALKLMPARKRATLMPGFGGIVLMFFGVAAGRSGRASASAPAGLPTLDARLACAYHDPLFGYRPQDPEFYLYLLSFVFSALMLSAAVRGVDSSGKQGWHPHLPGVSHGGCSRLLALRRSVSDRH